MVLFVVAKMLLHPIQNKSRSFELTLVLLCCTIIIFIYTFVPYAGLYVNV